MRRRSVLSVAGSWCAASLSGCVFASRRTPACERRHELVSSPEDIGRELARYRYENLSADAQYVFRQTIPTGSFATANRSIDVPEFRYGDEAAGYTIRYDGESFWLLTYGGAACRPD